jgi:TolA-binding protein
MHIFKALRWVFVLVLFSSITLNAQVNQHLNQGEDDYELAVELLEKQQYGNAQQIFDRIVEDPRYDDEKRMNARYFAAYCAIELYHGDIEERVTEFANIHETSPLQNRLWLRYANNLFSLKRYRQSLPYYERVDPYGLNQVQKGEYQFKWAYALMQNEQSQDALNLFLKLKDGKSAYASSARYYYAHLLYVDSNYAESLKNFLPLQEDPNFGPMVPYYLAHIYYQLEDYNKLVAIGEELIATASPGRAPEIAKLLSDAFFSRKDYANTLKYLELYQDKGGRMRLRDHYQAGYSYHQEKRYPEAIRSLNKITAGPDELRQNAYYHLGDAYLKVGEKNQSMVAFKAAADIDYNFGIQEDAYFNYAKLSYELASPFKDAIGVLKDFLRKYPHSPHRKDINAYLANIYITTKDYDRAMKAIQEVGMNSPEMRSIYQQIAFYRATEMFNSLKFAAALEKYRESQSYPENKDLANLAQYWIGECQYRLRDYEGARKSFIAFRKGKGAAAQTVYNRSYYHTAYCAYKVLDFKAAADDFRVFVRDAASDDPRKSDAYLRLGDAYLLTGGYLLASDFYQKAIQMNSVESAYAYFQRAVCLGLDGKTEAKIQELKTLLAKHSRSAYSEKAQFELGLTYLQKDDYQNSLAVFQEFRSNYPNSDRLLEVRLKEGLIYSNRDQNEKAIAVFKAVVKEYPETQEAYEAIRLAEIAYKRERRINDYLDWVADIDFIDIKESALDSTAYSAAFDIYADGKYDEAYRALDTYLSRFPKGVFREQASFLAADAALREGMSAEAYTLFEGLEHSANREYKLAALPYLAEKDFLDSNYALARERFQRYLLIAESKDQSTVARLGVLRASERLGDDDGILEHSAALLSMGGLDKNLLTEARKYRAFTYFRREAFSESYALFAAVKDASAGEQKAEAYYHMALIKKKAEAYDSSNALIQEMIEALPSYREWKMKALLLMAENFWKLDDIFQANYIIDFVIESEESTELVEKAKALKTEIQEAEARALAEKEALLKKQSAPVTLDDEGDLQFLDFQGTDEPLEEPEVIEK